MEVAGSIGGAEIGVEVARVTGAGVGPRGVAGGASTAVPAVDAAQPALNKQKTISDTKANIFIWLDPPAMTGAKAVRPQTNLAFISPSPELNKYFISDIKLSSPG